MKSFLSLLIILVFCFSCIKKPNDFSDVITEVEIRPDLSALEFKIAIIGKWKSVYTVKGKENVEYLEIDRKGKAAIEITKDSNSKTVVGDYNIKFIRTPEEGWGTEAKLTIKSAKENVILYHTNFYGHPFSLGIMLRNDSEPFAVLRKIGNN